MMLNGHAKNGFCVKQSSNLIGLGNFVAVGFSIIAGLGWSSPHQSKSDHFSTHQGPPHKFLHRPHESFTPPYYYLKWDIKV